MQGEHSQIMLAGLGGIVKRLRAEVGQGEMCMHIVRIGGKDFS